MILKMITHKGTKVVQIILEMKKTRKNSQEGPTHQYTSETEEGKVSPSLAANSVQRKKQTKDTWL